LGDLGGGKTDGICGGPGMKSVVIGPDATKESPNESPKESLNVSVKLDFSLLLLIGGDRTR